MISVTESAYAKINLYLDISGKRCDGYHNIISVMQAVSLSDIIRVDVNPGCGNSIGIKFDSPAIPSGKENLAWRAARLFADRYGSSDISIDIHKVIPAAAGLAGGSSDAAAVLRALNKIYGYPANVNELCRLGACLGADVPFCVAGGTAQARGIGDIIEKLPDMPDCAVVVACGGAGISTPEAYARLDREYNNFTDYKTHSDYEDKVVSGLDNSDLTELCSGIYNIFSGGVYRVNSNAKTAVRIMLDFGALAGNVSGSGPSVFGIFTDTLNAEKSIKAIKNTGSTAYLCRPVKRR